MAHHPPADPITSPDSWHLQHHGRVVALLELIQLAGDRTLDFFQTTGFQVERKSDHSPVTIADREAEEIVRKFVAEHFPQDGLLGEEFGGVGHDTEYRWIVDPIDGTKSFITGVPLYSTLLGLEHRGSIVAGAILIPALEEIAFASVGHGCWYRRGTASSWNQCRVSTRNQLKDAVFVTSQVDSFANYQTSAAFDRLQSGCWITRTWGDAYGYLLVATGRADIMVDPIVNPWDIAAVMPVIMEAGGRFSDWHGRYSVNSKDALGTNGVLHDEVLKLL